MVLSSLDTRNKQLGKNNFVVIHEAFRWRFSQKLPLHNKGFAICNNSNAQLLYEDKCVFI